MRDDLPEPNVWALIAEVVLLVLFVGALMWLW